jgi:hypothetical protein|tara:strand:+ start:1153 stop:1626 length:474 start_codon:yes stop_codon:yes gene_type:complete
MKKNPNNRIEELLEKIDLQKLPFKVNKEKLNRVGIDIANDLNKILDGLNKVPELKWCMSTVKKAKVFTKIYYANEVGSTMYKEELAKQLPEFSYKTIATIVDEGIAKGYYIPMDPYIKDIKDKKIKNIRPSLEVIIAFYNWNIERIATVYNLVEKYK